MGEYVIGEAYVETTYLALATRHIIKTEKREKAWLKRRRNTSSVWTAVLKHVHVSQQRRNLAKVLSMGNADETEITSLSFAMAFII